MNNRLYYMKVFFLQYRSFFVLGTVIFVLGLR